jgi:hypothetical protein
VAVFPSVTVRLACSFGDPRRLFERSRGRCGAGPWVFQGTTLYSKYNKLPEKKLIKINRILQFIAIFFQGFGNQGTCNEITIYVPCLIGASLVASGAGGANDSVHN